MTNELLPKNWVFFSKLRRSSSPSKLEGAHDIILGEFPFFHEASNICINFFFPNPSSQVVHNHHLVLWGGGTSPKLGIICERHWLLNWLMKLSNTWSRLPKQAMPTYQNILHAWRMRCLNVILAPIGSDHHPKPVDTFPST